MLKWNLYSKLKIKEITLANYTAVIHMTPTDQSVSSEVKQYVYVEKKSLIGYSISLIHQVASSFTHCQVVPNLYEFLSSVDTKEDISESFVIKQLTVTIDFHSMEKNTMQVNGYQQLFGFQHPLKYLHLCSSEERNYRIGTVWGWVNDDRIFKWHSQLLPQK